MRRLAVGIVVLIAGMSIATTAVTVADPALSRPSPPDVDASDSPATIAEDALAQTRHRDYVVTANRSTTSDDADFESDPTANFLLDFRMDVTDREYRMHRHSGFEPLPRVMYGNSIRSWGRFDSSDDTLNWGSYGVRWGNDEGLFPRFDPIDLEEEPVTLVRANDSTVVLNVTDPETAYQLDSVASGERPSDLSGYASITVDRETGAPRQITVVTAGTIYDGEIRYRRRTVMTFVDWDDVDVSRPRTVPYTIDEIARDASRIDDSSGVVG